MRTTTMGILALGLLTGTAQADDSALRDALVRRLAEGIRVEVIDGIVTLEGTVRSVGDKRDAIERATETDGVVALEDKMEVARGESDNKVAEDVAKAVRRYVFFTIYDDVNVAVDEGNVSLTGRVTMPFKSDEIEERVSKVMGVQSVTNEIATLPTNIGDQRLRAALAYRIYRDPLFRDLASRVNPPIHIVVERGRVALTGAVRSEVEKRKAEHIARSTFGVFGVDNRLAVGS